MKKTAILAIGLTALAVTACAPGYQNRDYRYGYADSRYGYPDSRYGYADRDRDGLPNRYDRDRDNDGVPNAYDRRPANPYRN